MSSYTRGQEVPCEDVSISCWSASFWPSRVSRTFPHRLGLWRYRFVGLCWIWPPLLLSTSLRRGSEKGKWMWMLKGLNSPLMSTLKPEHFWWAAWGPTPFENHQFLPSEIREDCVPPDLRIQQPISKLPQCLEPKPWALSAGLAQAWHRLGVPRWCAVQSSCLFDERHLKTSSLTPGSVQHCRSERGRFWRGGRGEGHVRVRNSWAESYAVRAAESENSLRLWSTRGWGGWSFVLAPASPGRQTASADTELCPSGLCFRWYLGAFYFVNCLGLRLEYVSRGVGVAQKLHEEKGRAQQRGGWKGFAL